MVKYSTLKLKSRLGLTFLTGALLFVSCSDGEEPNKVVEPVSVPVRFSSGLSRWIESTRATDSSWEANDQVGIYMVPHVAEASAAAGFSTYSTTANTPYVVSGNGASVSLAVAGGQKEMVYPSDGSNVNFVAYYPYQADTHTAKANVYKVDVSNQSSAKAIDLLYHKGTGTAYNRDRNSNVTLAFTHQLSKLKIDLVPASGVEADLTGAALTLSGFPATADFNLSTGVLGNVSGTTGTLTPVKVSSSPGGAAFEAIVIPHGGTSYTRNVRFTINGTSYNYALPASGVFKAGTAHSYKFRFTGDAIEPATEIVNNPYGEGGTVSWGDYQMTADKFAFDLPAGRTLYNTVTLSTNAPSALAVSWSGEADDTDAPAWITGVSLSDGTAGNDGWKNYTLTFGTDYNVNPEAAPRTGYIRLEADGLSLPVRVTQTAQAYTTGEPDPPSFNVPAGGKTGNTFTIRTNAQDEDIEVTPSEAWITILSKQRGTVADDGTSTWTIGFDVSANTDASGREATISVSIGGVDKTVTVSQAATYVNDPEPDSFNVPAAGKTGNTFTITTNAPDITVTTTSEWITTLLPVRGTVADDGSSTWTIGFDVSANTTFSSRWGSITVTVGGQTKTVYVSQVGAYINGPVSQRLYLSPAVSYNNTFTITTNAPDIAMTTTSDWITNLTKQPGAVANDGSSMWTIGFDVIENTTSSYRNGSITVAVGEEVKIWVYVRQGLVFIHDLAPLSFHDLPAAGKAGNTFTITTSTPDITVTTTSDWITNTNPTKVSEAVATDDYPKWTWTVTFDVTANTGVYGRSDYITVTAGGQETTSRTVYVSQVAAYVNDPVPASFPDVPVAGKTGNLFTITTNAQDEDITVTTTSDWITNLTPVRGAVAADGSSTWTISFDVSKNISTSPRSGYIDVTVGGRQPKLVSVSQEAMYINNPVPDEFSDLPAAGKAGNSFTIRTNAPDEDITVTTTYDWITNLTPVRGIVADDGSYTWTIGFDVSKNASTSARSGSIDVTVGGRQLKWVSVSQEAMYVNDPVPASFPDLPAAGKTGNTFTIRTNAPDEDITVTTTNTWVITNLTPVRGAVAADGSSTWTIGFDVTANASTSSSGGYITVTVGGQRKTVYVSQVARYVNDPVPASFSNMPGAGATGNTFILTTDVPDEDITVTARDYYGSAEIDWITNLTPVRGAVADDGSSTWTIGFDVVTENISTSARSGQITVTVGGVTKTVSVSQVGLLPVQALDGTSNCYMVVPGQSVTFRISRAYCTFKGGNTTNTLRVGGTYDGAFGAEVVWADASVINGTPTVSGSGNTAEVTVGTTNTSGNAVVKIYKAGDGSKTPVWSYHIWVTDYDGSVTYTNTYNTNNNGKNFVFMDRNLGATKAGLLTSNGTGANFGFGLFYQWGRKDPFPATLNPGATQPGGGTFTAVGISSSKGTITYTLQHPDEFLAAYGSLYDWHYGSRDNALWGHSGVKTIYDPCPPGWRVPKNSNMSEATSPWYGFTTGNGGTWSYGYNWGTNALYPAAGLRDYSGGSISNAGSFGLCWSASPSSSSSDTASGLGFYSSGYSLGVSVVGGGNRAFGFSVRCVRE